MKTEPAISVVIPNYNYAHYLGECMQSVIDQTFTDWEMIVVDDGSTDNSRELVESFIKKYPDKRIKYIYKEDGPGGTPAAVNLGIKTSNGKYIAWLSSDDAYMPKKLEMQFEYMEKNLGVALTYTKVYQMNEKGEIIGKYGVNIDDPDRIVFELLKGCIINGNTVLIRKGVFEKLGLFRENDAEYNNEFSEIWRATEYEKWIEIGMNFKISLIPQHLHKWRVHQENTPYNEINAKIANIVTKRIVEKSQIEDIFPKLKEFPQDQILYLTSLLELLFLCYQKNWFDLAAKYLKEIGKIDEGVQEKISKSFSQETKKLSSLESLKSILLGIKESNIDLNSWMRRFSELGIQEGILLLQKGDYSKGGKVFEEWYEFDQGNIKINYSLGSCYQKEGKLSEAIDKFRRVLSIPTDQKEIFYTGAHFHLGEIYQIQGRLEEARQEFKECLKLNPGHKAAKKTLREILRSECQRKDSIEKTGNTK